MAREGAWHSGLTAAWRMRVAPRPRFWLAFAFLAAAAAIIGAYALLRPLPVSTHTVARGSVAAEVLGTGTLEARTSAVVGPKMSGLILRVGADEGDRVEAGDLLIQLEDRDVRQQVGVADSERAAAAAAVERLRASTLRAEAVAKQARADLERTRELVRGNVASAKDLEKASEATAIADAEHASAVAGLRETEKRLLAAERGLEVQRARLDDTTIEAPFDALVVRRDRDPGDVVTAGSSILRIVSTDEMWITAWVDETELARLAADQPARVTFRSEPDVEYPGRVARIGREADRETREVVVDVRLSELPARWAVGQRADVMIEAARRDDVVVLPADLLRMREGAPGVFIDEDGRARWRPVTVGARGRAQVEVVAGLSAGDVVVHPAGAPNDPIREGRRIHAQ